MIAHDMDPPSTGGTDYRAPLRQRVVEGTRSEVVADPKTREVILGTKLALIRKTQLVYSVGHSVGCAIGQLKQT